ncbi:MAG: hydrolase [Caulobacteraceae bacterium]|nr:hydrolase [Caulobacteraceae bacterium]
MPISPFYADLRSRLGHDLLLVPGVAAIVHDREGRVLIQARPEGDFSLPAGAIEPGESPAQAIVREVREETGLTVRPTALLGVFGGEAYRQHYPNGDEVEHLVCLFRCEIIAGELRALDGESAALGFYPVTSLPPLATAYPLALFMPDAEGAAFN